MNQPVIASGTKPPIAGGETQAAAWVQRMFASIAGRYDLLNHLLSFNIDRGWRQALIHELQEILGDQDATILDLCCGTGDVLLEMKMQGRARLLGIDFCHPMLLSAQRKLRALDRPTRAHSNSTGGMLIEADALALPVADGALDAIAIAFGFRNLANYRGGLVELCRALKPGGKLAILEFSHPKNVLMRLAYGLYLRIVLPLAGGLISGSIRAYSYLPASIRRFPRAEQLAGMMQETGFELCRYRLLTGGIAALHVCSKSVSAHPISNAG